MIEVRIPFSDADATTYRITPDKDGFWRIAAAHAGDVQMLDAGSVKEFAFSMRPAESAERLKWAPRHGSVTTTSGHQLEIAGVTEGGWTEVEEVRLVQTFDTHTAGGKEPPLSRVRIEHVFRPEGVEVNGRIEFLQDVYIGAGYPTMLAGYRLSGFRTDRGDDILVNRDSGHESFAAGASSVIAWKDEVPGLVMAMDLIDANSTTRAGLPGSGDPMVLVVDRPDNVDKLYWRAFHRTTVPAGEVYEFGARWFSGRIDELPSLRN